VSTLSTLTLWLLFVRTYLLGPWRTARTEVWFLIYPKVTSLIVSHGLAQRQFIIFCRFVWELYFSCCLYGSEKKLNSSGTLARQRFFHVIVQLPWLRFFHVIVQLPWLRFFRAFSLVVRQMPGYNSPRQGTVRTVSIYFCVVSIYFFVYCLCVNVYCTTATGWQPNCS
jgi:hypothetical protein